MGPLVPQDELQARQDQVDAEERQRAYTHANAVAAEARATIYWGYVGGRYQWIAVAENPGMAPSDDYFWVHVPPFWENQGGRWVHVEGHWIARGGAGSMNCRR